MSEIECSSAISSNQAPYLMSCCSLISWSSSCTQVVTSRDSQETLLVIAFVFEVSTSEHGAQHHVYKLVKD